jgi:hypothetical protein
MYKNNIAQCPPLKELDAASVLSHTRAAAIIANTPLDINDVSAAIKEAKAREQLKLIASHLVTDVELHESTHRANTVAAEYYSQLINPGDEDPDACPPTWFGPAFAKAIEPLSTRVDNLSTRVDKVDANINALFIKTDNLEGKHRNSVTYSHPLINDRLFPLRKTSAGIGPGLCGHNAALPANVPTAIGETFPLFPAYKKDVDVLTYEQLSALSAFYCDDFGILDSDTLYERRSKFEQYIT